ncbi:peptidase inhibitor family I36 protein [Nostoc sp.]|uniref:peptidase inhibitor family I36 protein n=1 Tax=Nostoc sp. TaxID=1180 RepID=UPI002FFA93CC
MSNINNQTQDLYSIELVQDLDHEAAATVTGGALNLYTDFGFQGKHIVLTKSTPNLGSYDDRDASYVVTGNSNWEIFSATNYTGIARRLIAGTSGNFTGIFHNNVQSALRL